MNDTVFIYALNDPTTGRCRYVGKSVAPKDRLRGHIRRLGEGRSHKNNWVKKLRARGLKPVLEILDEVPQTEWQFWEREYIRVFRAIGIDLLNVSDGGESPPPITEELREKLRRKVFTAEHRANISAAKQGCSRTISDDTKNKMSATATLLATRRIRDARGLFVGRFHPALGQ